MRVGELLGATPHRWVQGVDDQDVVSVTHDSRRAGPGAVFVALRGGRTDGLNFAGDAARRGAGAVIVGRGRSGVAELKNAPRVIEVDDERTALAVMARNLHGRVDERLPIVGVTGTNGKTTTCCLVAAVLEAAGWKVGQLGTISYKVGDAEIDGRLTTPEAPDIHGYLSRMAAAGCGGCVMEVSSHSLDRRRVHGIEFAVAVFTNLTRDHLDYHRDMESYFRAKSALFDNLGPKAVAVVNVDDPYGRRLASACRNASDQAGRRLITFGAGGEATLRATRIDTGDKGCHVTLETDEGAVELESPLMGRINAENMMAAAGAARAMGIAWKTIARGVASVPAVPGRLEPVTVPAVPGRNPQDFRVFVDYAHTDDALRKLLQTVREITTGRVIVVFGCGGDRDRTKRPLMGAHAEELADVVYLTSDNSRGERPESIIGEILAGMKHSTPGGGRVHVETDRRKAIEQAITTARAGDVVVIAGKGHETYQITGDGITRFDDRVAAREVLERTLGS